MSYVSKSKGSRAGKGLRVGTVGGCGVKGAKCWKKHVGRRQGRPRRTAESARGVRPPPLRTSGGKHRGRGRGRENADSGATRATAASSGRQQRGSGAVDGGRSAKPGPCLAGTPGVTGAGGRGGRCALSVGENRAGDGRSCRSAAGHPGPRPDARRVAAALVHTLARGGTWHGAPRRLRGHRGGPGK